MDRNTEAFSWYENLFTSQLNLMHCIIEWICRIMSTPNGNTESPWQFEFYPNNSGVRFYWNQIVNVLAVKFINFDSTFKYKHLDKVKSFFKSAA